MEEKNNHINNANILHINIFENLLRNSLKSNRPINIHLTYSFLKINSPMFQNLF